MKKLILAISFAACTATGALAQDQQPAEQEGPPGGIFKFMQTCGADLHTYCASAESRDDRRACVIANKDKFSDACKALVASHQPAQGQTQETGDGQQ